MEHYSLLADRGVLAVQGPDAREFLQGLITNDIRKVNETTVVFAALLSPQGKFLYDFFIIEREGKLWLETERARISDLHKRLQMYRLRAQVTIEDMPQLQVAASWGDVHREKDFSFADPRLPALGKRMIAPSLPNQENIPAYERHRIRLGVPSGSNDLTVDRSLLLEFGYDELGAIDFAKGCYVGQEVTARSKHRAQLHKFIHIVEGNGPLPPAGTVVTAQGRDIGVMASSAGDTGLALLRVKEAQAGDIVCAGIALTARLPDWCRTSFSHAK